LRLAIETGNGYVSTRKPGGSCFTINKQILNRVLWIDRTGAQWKGCRQSTARNPLYTSVSKAGKIVIVEAVFAELSKEPDMQDLSFDSSSSRVHQHAARAKRGAKK